MTYDIYNRIQHDINLKRYLREHSNWYKILNRNPDSFPSFVEEMKVNYKLTTSDKINDMTEKLEMLQMFLNVMK